ncbi:MAG: response regulator transcription factor [Firmicutes bacterium]|nr:response regulator transcription factor [Bacillota bacterium]
MPRILVVEDDRSLREVICDLLADAQYEGMPCGDGEEAVHLAIHGSYDVILLDVMLPGLDGLQVASALRKQKVFTPIVMLTAMDQLDARVRGLESGADDYLVKPFASIELIARIRAQLRRTSPDYHDSETLVYGVCTLRLSTRELMVGDACVTLTPKEANLIELLFRYPGTVLTRHQLIDRLWGYDSDVLDNTLEAHVSKLRRHLRALGGPEIHTIRGLGYRVERQP